MVKRVLVGITSALLILSGTAYAAVACRFSSRNAALNFGLLDPANPVDVNANTTIVVRCGGSDPDITFFLDDDDGLYEAGPDLNRMRNTVVTTEYLPYTLSFNPPSGTTIPRNVNVTVTISGTVTGLDYRNAYIGSYSDTVVISITP